MAADAGQPIGQNNMGHIYENGLGVTADREEALRWYQLAADQNYDLAVENLDRLQNAGDDVPAAPATTPKGRDKISK